MAPPAVIEILRALGIDYPADFRAIEQMPFDQGVQALVELKERARKNYKRLAFEWHPDRTGNDPDKTEKFKALASLREQIERITLRPAPPPVPAMRIHVRHVYAHPFVTMNVTNTTATSTATTSYGPGGPWYTARMRPL